MTPLTTFSLRVAICAFGCIAVGCSTDGPQVAKKTRPSTDDAGSPANDAANEVPTTGQLPVEGSYRVTIDWTSSDGGLAVFGSPTVDERRLDLTKLGDGWLAVVTPQGGPPGEFVVGVEPDALILDGTAYEPGFADACSGDHISCRLRRLRLPIADDGLLLGTVSVDGICEYGGPYGEYRDTPWQVTGTLEPDQIPPHLSVFGGPFPWSPWIVRASEGLVGLDPEVVFRLSTPVTPYVAATWATEPASGAPHWDSAMRWGATLQDWALVSGQDVSVTIDAGVALDPSQNGAPATHVEIPILDVAEPAGIWSFSQAQLPAVFGAASRMAAGDGACDTDGCVALAITSGCAPADTTVSGMGVRVATSGKQQVFLRYRFQASREWALSNETISTTMTVAIPEERIVLALVGEQPLPVKSGTTPTPWKGEWNEASVSVASWDAEEVGVSIELSGERDWDGHEDRVVLLVDEVWAE